MVFQIILTGVLACITLPLVLIAKLYTTVIKPFPWPTPSGSPKSILITGASYGLGAAFAEAYAGPGVTLALTARSEDKLAGVRDACEAKGATVLLGAIDVTDRDAMAAFVEEADAAAPLDLVIANAGVSEASAGMAKDLEGSCRWLTDVNLVGVYNTVFPALDKMKERGHGQIALMSSLAGYDTRSSHTHTHITHTYISSCTHTHATTLTFHTQIRGNACKRGVLYVQERSQGVWIWPAWCCYPPWGCCFDHLPWVCRVRDDPDQQVPHALPHEPGPSHYLHDGPAGSQRWSHRLPLAHGHVGVVDAEHGLGRRQRHHVPPLPRPQAPARTLCRRSSLFLLVEERLMGKTWPTYCPCFMGCERGGVDRP